MFRFPFQRTASGVTGPLHHLAALKPKGPDFELGKEKGQTLGEPLSRSAGSLAETPGAARYSGTFWIRSSFKDASSDSLQKHKAHEITRRAGSLTAAG